eukprot:5621607-Amphidinium_carterae.1
MHGLVLTRGKTCKSCNADSKGNVPARLLQSATVNLWATCKPAVFLALGAAQQPAAMEKAQDNRSTAMHCEVLCACNMPSWHWGSSFVEVVASFVAVAAAAWWCKPAALLTRKNWASPPRLLKRMNHHPFHHSAKSRVVCSTQAV